MTRIRTNVQDHIVRENQFLIFFFLQRISFDSLNRFKKTDPKFSSLCLETRKFVLHDELLLD